MIVRKSFVRVMIWSFKRVQKSAQIAPSRIARFKDKVDTETLNSYLQSSIADRQKAARS